MKKSWEIIAEMVTPNIKKVLAKAFSVCTDTVSCWARMPKSVERPTATGKHNPIDQTERYIRIAHIYDPGNAREAVNYLEEIVNQLDREAGLLAAKNYKDPCACLAEAVQENADYICVLSRKPNDPKSWKNARTEIQQAIGKLHKLDSCLEELLETEDKKR